MKSTDIKQVFKWVAIIIVLLLIVAWAAWSSFMAPTKYHAVSLASGELYFGELQHFPTYGLKNVYTINVNPQNEEQPFSIQKFENIFWGPEDFMNLNRDHVLWTAKLTNQSQLTQLLRNNPDLIPQQSGEQVPGGAVPAEGNQIPGASDDSAAPSE